MSLEISQQASSFDAKSIPQPIQPLTAAVSIKLPPYWSNDPALWFSRLKHSSPHTEFAHVIGSLQPEVAQEVHDLLINPPAENLYTQLKSELVKRTSASEQQRLHQLLNVEQLGDRKPTPTPNATVTWRKSTRVFNYDATISTTPSNKCTTHLSLI